MIVNGLVLQKVEFSRNREETEMEEQTSNKTVKISAKSRLGPIQTANTPAVPEDHSDHNIIHNVTVLANTILEAAKKYTPRGRRNN